MNKYKILYKASESELLCYEFNNNDDLIEIVDVVEKIKERGEIFAIFDNLAISVDTIISVAKI